MIGRNDYSRIAEYDGLFIRETTALDNHTYRFANKAEKEGMVVIDDPGLDPQMHEQDLSARSAQVAQAAAPKTEILYRDDRQAPGGTARYARFSLVLKIPDGSFSRGIIKCETDGRIENRGR